jgi:hypothetical protein
MTKSPEEYLRLVSIDAPDEDIYQAWIIASLLDPFSVGSHPFGYRFGLGKLIADEK